MRGPYDLDFVTDYVEVGSIGVYMLGAFGRTGLYVGRSDTDLLSRIESSAKQGWRPQRYLYFWFEYTTSPMRAYKRECELWHKWMPPDNKNHPAVPPGTNWRCPVRGCPYS